MSRTLSNLRGALILLDSKQIVEARTIIRCCFENAYWVQGVSVDGVVFGRKMVNSQMHYRKSRGQSIFEGPVVLTEDDEARLREWMKSAAKSFGDAKTLNVKDVASSYKGKDTYIFYNLLSSDSAHPSIQSLNRYLKMNPKDQLEEIVVDPVIDESEVEESFELLCLAIMGVCEYANQILNWPINLAELEALATEFKSLSETCAELRS